MPDRANHAIRDGDLPIVYISGDKGLYKFFPDSGQIALMKAVAGDEIAYMAAYGSLTRRTLPIAIAVELVFLPAVPQGSSMTNTKYVIRHYKLDGTVVNIVPPVASVQWTGIEVSPFNPDKWVIWSSTHGPSGNPLLFITSNAGTSWTQVMLPVSTPQHGLGIHFVYWSRHTDNFLWVAASPSNEITGGTSRSISAYYGNPTSSMNRVNVVVSGARFGYWAVAGVADNGTFYGRTVAGGSLSKTYKRVIIDATGSYILNEATTLVIPSSTSLFVPGTATFLFANPTSLWRLPNYLIGEVSDTGMVMDTNLATVTATTRVFLGGSENNGVREILSPLGTPSIAPAPVIGPGLPSQAIAVDPSTRSVVAALSIRTPSQLYLFVFNGTEWQELSLAELIDANWVWPNDFAVIVRS